MLALDSFPIEANSSQIEIVHITQYESTSLLREKIESAINFLSFQGLEQNNTLTTLMLDEYQTDNSTIFENEDDDIDFNMVIKVDVKNVLYKTAIVVSREKYIPKVSLD